MSAQQYFYNTCALYSLSPEAGVQVKLLRSIYIKKRCFLFFVLLILKDT